MGAYVFSLGLVPVREWIAQARRSRDLRVGSVFLWHTMARVLARLQDHLQADVWLPQPPPGCTLQELAGLSFPGALGQDYGIPNRASGACIAEEGRVRKTFQGLQEDVVFAAWTKLREEGFGSLQKIDPGLWQELEPYWRRYLTSVPNGEDCPLSLVWAACPAPHPLDEEHREKNLEAADRLYAAVKRTRPVPPVLPGHSIGKCTQCGQREAIGPTESFPIWRDWYARELDANESVVAGRRLDPGERLCYVCLARRLAGYPQGSRKKFPSTGEIAAAAWLRGREQDPRTAPLLRKLEATEIGREDLGRALYASRRELPGPEGEEVLGVRAEIRSATPEAPPLPGYLALLAFDGDDMGKRVRRDSRLLSEGMSRFATLAHERLTQGVEEPPARPACPQAAIFYLGGDEGLAMVPAAAALGMAAGLRRLFQESFTGLAAPPTLSVGIAFFEHSRPMRGAILAAGEALDAAKALDGKDALGVRVETASGNRWGFAAHWGPDWDRIQAAVRLIGERRLSPGWAYDVERFLETLPEDAELWRRTVAAVRAEVKRLFFRRFRPPGPTAEARRAARVQAWKDLPGESWWEGGGKGELAAVHPQQFHLIGFLARQLPEALAEEAEA